VLARPAGVCGSRMSGSPMLQETSTQFRRHCFIVTPNPSCIGGASEVTRYRISYFTYFAGITFGNSKISGIASGGAM